MNPRMQENEREYGLGTPGEHPPDAFLLLFASIRGFIASSVAGLDDGAAELGDALADGVRVLVGVGQADVALGLRPVLLPVAIEAGAGHIRDATRGGGVDQPCRVAGVR